MISIEDIRKSIAEQLLKERMIVEAFLILSDAEWFQERIEEKLLEIDAAESEYRYGELPLLRNQVLSLLAGLRGVEQSMDNYMAKYKKLVYAQKTLLSSPCSKEPIHIRSVPPKRCRKTKGSRISKKDAKAT